jgi:hypothetical protein
VAPFKYGGRSAFCFGVTSNIEPFLRVQKINLAQNDDVELVTKMTQETQSFPNLVQADPREMPPFSPQRAAAWPPMVTLLLGTIDAPHGACSQLARASEVTWKWSVISLLLVFRAPRRLRACLIFYSRAWPPTRSTPSGRVWSGALS